MNENILSVFMIVTCLAIILQAGILAALYVTVRKTSSKVEALAERALPVLDSARTVLEDSAPKLKEITSNLVSTTGTLKGQVDRMDATVNDLLDRSRLQVIRVDELVSRSLDRVEETTELVQQAVVSPVKQISGIIQGLSAGVGALIMRRRSQQGDELVVEDEELFI